MDENSGLTFPDVPRGDLDQALGTLIELANHVTATQGRLRALLRANQAVVEHLELPIVLRKIVETAVELVDAQYGALGILAADGSLEQLVQVGMSASEAEAIGHLPVGRGLVGALIDERHPIRIPHLAEDPRFRGFPVGHPAMDSFLGIPINVRGEQYGNLYLTNQASGEFSAEDEQLVIALANTAGFAIDNARLFADSRRRQAWSAASAEITAALLASDQHEFVELLTSRTLTLAEADLVCIVRLGETADELVVETARSRDESVVEVRAFPAAGSLSASVIEGRQPRLIDEAEALELPSTPGHLRGPAMAIPLVATGGAPGALIVSRGRGGARFTTSDLEMAADFAGRVSVAMQLASARADQQRVLLWEERARISRDLHDHVIQQLFATGLELHSVVGALAPGPILNRVARSIDTLDSTSSRIRTAIFSLSRVEDDSPTIRHRIIDVAEELADVLPLAPQIEFTGPVDLVIKDSVSDDIVAVAREALTNVVKHAFARHVSLSISVVEDLVTVEVIDDGIGASGTTRRSGLANLEKRALLRGGEFAFDSAAGRTCIRWSVPLIDTAEPETV